MMMQYPPGASFPPVAATYSTVYVFSQQPAPPMAAGRPPPPLFANAPSPQFVGRAPYAAYPPPGMVFNAASVPAAAYQQFYHHPASMMVGGYAGVAGPYPHGGNNTATMAAMANQGGYGTAGGAAHAAVMYAPSPMFGVVPIPSPPDCGASPPPAPCRRPDGAAAAVQPPSAPLSSNDSVTQHSSCGCGARSAPPSSSSGRHEAAATRRVARSDNTSDFVPAGRKDVEKTTDTMPSAHDDQHAFDANDDDDDFENDFRHEAGAGKHGADEVGHHPKRGMRQLIVNYLDNEATGPELFRIFAEVGKVDSARVMYDPKTNQPLGYGFVYFADPEAARDAVACMNGYPLRKKRLKVSFANPLKQTVRSRQRVAATTNNNSSSHHQNANQNASAKAQVVGEDPSKASKAAAKVEPGEFGGGESGSGSDAVRGPSAQQEERGPTSARDGAANGQTEKAACPSTSNGPSNSDSNAEGSGDSETSSAIAQRISGQKTEGAVREWTGRVHDEAGRVATLDEHVGLLANACSS